MFDSHAHLCDEKFNHDRDDVIQRAYDNGVTAMLVVADSLNTCEQVCSLAARYSNMYPTAGIHPHNAAFVSEDTVVDLEHFIKTHRDVKAVGETGLDYYYGHDTVTVQKVLFEKQVCLADSLKLPLVIHCRDSQSDIVNILNKYSAVQGVFHCFSSDETFCNEVLEMGFYVSFSGIITFKNAQAIRDAAHCVPLDKLLVETDCPYLAPQGYRGKRNEPAFISATVKCLAEIKQCHVDEIVKRTTENARTLFQIED
ncbi:MAG: TatD family deoxyribonuclease [Candidatus Auribacter fodinae]|jgi:TatD DNase family protein|uniref:TatD family deoxyribonuclease n=1 Tax=Candidatus Auribacter fodinae TaxID=2093366 RepID=A0A3A4QU56_9BACT|nr:MAG: TatD family deoxyribonuclease [Candidatus Auribacter fodinae]